MKESPGDYFVRQLRVGDNEAYRKLYDLYYVSLCSIAYTLVHDRFTAETIVNDTIFHLWEIRMEASLQPSVRSYLVRAVHNRALNYLASREKNVLIRFFGTTADPHGDFSMESSITPASRLLEEDLKKKIAEALREMPPASRAVFLLKRNRNYSYQELSSHFGISVNTVKYHLKTAMSFLRRSLKDYL